MKLNDFIDTQFIKVLHEPHSSLKDEEKELIWKLLVKIMPKDPVHLYWYDKEQFYRSYAQWNPTYRDWVIDEILENNKKHAV